MIIHTYVVYDSRRTLYDFGEKGKLVALTLHRFYVLKLAHHTKMIPSIMLPIT